MVLLKDKIRRNRNRKVPARAKRNFRKVARKVVQYSKPKPVMKQGDTKDFLKITMNRTLYKKNFLPSIDGSMYHDILFNVAQNLNTTGTGVSNLFYHPDAAALLQIYNRYKCACIVMKFSRPNIPISWNNANLSNNQLNALQLPTVPLGSKIMHTTIDYAPDDNPSSGIQSNAGATASTRLQLRQITNHPVSWREGCDDGKRLFRNHQYKRYFTRVWKPANAFEKRWVDKVAGNTELVRGGIHLRYEKECPVMLDGVTGVSNNYNINSDVAMLNIEATIYMKYTDRY